MISSITKNLDSNYKYERKKRYTATQRKKKVGTKLFTQLLRGGWKLAKTTSRRDRNKAPEKLKIFLKVNCIIRLRCRRQSNTSPPLHFRTIYQSRKNGRKIKPIKKHH